VFRKEALYYIIYIQIILPDPGISKGLGSIHLYADDTQLVAGFHSELIGWAFEKFG